MEQSTNNTYTRDTRVCEESGAGGLHAAAPAPQGGEEKAGAVRPAAGWSVWYGRWPLRPLCCALFCGAACRSSCPCSFRWTVR